jgi:putative tricarboxylic transport membrane protein
MRRSTFLKAFSAQALSACAVVPRARAADEVNGASGAHAMSIMVPASPGGGWDTTARVLGDALLGARQAAIVNFETRSGAAGTIGLAQFAKDRAGDANALMVMGSVMLGGIISGKPPVSLDAVTPIARLTSEYNVIVVPAGSAFTTMRQVIAQFNKDPASVRWGGGSRGSTEHIALGLLAQALGLATSAINYVPFRGGGEAAAALLSGAVMVASSGVSEFLPHIAAGRMVPLAVTAPQRLAALPSPTLLELGYPVVFGNWRGVYGAHGISAAQRDELIARVRLAVQSDAWRAGLARYHWSDAFLTSAAFEQFVQSEFTTIAQTMAAAGLS